MSENAEIRVKFEIGEIKFEAEGPADLVERERSVFTDTLLPSAIDAIVRTRGVTQTTQYIEPAEQTGVLLPAGNNADFGNDCTDTLPNMDLSRTSLSSYIKNLGVLSDQDFTLIAAYYDEKKNAVQSFTSESVKQYYSDARRGKYSNYSDLLQRLAQKGYIMDDPKAEKKVPKPYILTDAGIKYVEAYQPKENGSEKPKATKTRRLRSKQISIYSTLCADDLSLKNYPEVKAQDSFKNQMMLLLFIVASAGKGDTFTVVDVEYLMTDMLGLPSTTEQIKGIFKPMSST